jgi:UDP-N-acetylmuramyl tripeptide synthase
MIELNKIQPLFWFNPFSIGPVAVASIQLNEEDRWDFTRVSSEVREILQNQLGSKQPIPENPRLRDFFLWTTVALQENWGVEQPVAKFFRNEETGKTYLTCAYADFATTDLILGTAVSISNLLCSRRGRKIFTLTSELSNIIANLDKQALPPATRAVLREATRRGIAWQRIIGNKPSIRFGHGANARIIGIDDIQAQSGFGTLHDNSIINGLLAKWKPDDIPIAMITGSKGKTTTCLMLSKILEAAGHTTGISSTDGLIINGEWTFKGDIAGPVGAGAVLSNSTITAAVLETSRGGLLQRGIAVPRCDVAALLNIKSEHLGVNGVKTPDDMLSIKRRVTDIATKKVVLNADDPLTRKLAFEYPAKSVIVFTRNDDPKLTEELEKRYSTILKFEESENGNQIVIIDNQIKSSLALVNSIPQTMNGAHRANIANAMAAAGLALALDIPLSSIRDGLQNFEMTKPGEPGRMIWLETSPFRVLVDYAYSADALKVVADTLSRIDIRGKRICFFSAGGSRSNKSFDDMAAAVADSFDIFFCFDRPGTTQDRPPGEHISRLGAGLKKCGVKQKQIFEISDPDEAMSKAIEIAEAGDLLTILSGSTDYLLELFERQFGDGQGPSNSS